LATKDAANNSFQRFTIQTNNTLGGVGIVAYNGKFIGAKDGILTNLNSVVLQTAATKTSTWVMTTL
jgi:hypothetical protein